MLYDGTQNAVFYYTFGLSACSLVVCGMCKQATHVAGKTRRELAEYMYVHWRNDDLVFDDGRRAHESVFRPSKSEIEAFLKEELPHSDAKVVGRQQSVVICDTLINPSTLADPRLRFKQESLVVCLNCLCKKTLKQACCSPGESITVPAYVRNRCVPLVILPPTECSLIYERRSQLIGSRNPRTVSPIHHRLVVDHGSSSTIALLPGSTSPGNPANVQLAANPVQHGSSVRTNPVTLADLSADFLSELPETCRYDLESQKLTFIDENNPSKRLVIDMSRLLSPSLMSDKASPPPPRENKSCLGSNLVSMFFSRMLTLEEKMNSATISAPIDKSVGRELLLLRSASAFFESSAEKVSDFPRIELSIISKLPLYCDAARSVSVARGNDPMVISTSEFFETQSTRNRHALHLARVLNTYIKARLPGHMYLLKEIQKVEEANAMINALSNGNTPVKDWDLQRLPDVVKIFCLSLAKNKDEIISDVLKHFAFTLCSTSAEGENEIDDEDDPPVEQLDQQNVDEDSSNESVKISSPSQVKAVCGAVLSAFKRAALCDIHIEREAMKQQYFESQTLVTETCANVLAYVEDFKGCLNPPALAHYISQLGNLIPATASSLNAVSVSGPQHDPVVHLGIKVLHAEDIRAGGRRICATGRKCFLMCLNPALQFSDDGNANGVTSANLRAMPLWDALLNPKEKEFEICEEPKLKRAHLKELGNKYAALKELAQAAFNASPLSFANHVDGFREYLFAAIHVFLGCVLRTEELCNIQLCDAEGNGNLYRAVCLTGESTLAFCGVITKTKRETFGQVPFWLGRLILIYFQIFTPLVVDALKHQILHVVAECTDPPNFDLRNFETFARNLYGSAMSFRCDMSPTFWKALRTPRDDLEAEVVLSRESFFQIHKRGMRELLCRMVCRVGFGADDLTIPRLRHFLIGFKVNIGRFLDALFLDATDEMKHRIKMLQADIEANVAGQASVNSLGTIGGHSIQTDMQVYQFRDAVGALPTQPAEVKVRATRLVEHGLQLFFEMPCLAYTKESLQVLNGNRNTIWDSLTEQEKVSDDPADLHSYLLENLASLIHAQDWTSSEQQAAVLHLVKTKNDACIFLPCGSGKTIIYALAYGLASSGFAFVIVPFRALLESQMLYFQNVLNLACEEMDLRDERFSPQCFASGQRGKTDLIRFVFAVTDTAVKTEARRFIHAAKVYGLLNAIVVDEVHQIFVSQQFRSVMEEVSCYSTYDAPLVLVSGTVPASFESTLLHTFGVYREVTPIFRRDVVYGSRLVVHLVRFDTARTKEHVHDYIERFLQEKSEQSPNNKRTLVFSMTKSLNWDLYERVKRMFSNRSDVICVRIDSDSTPHERAEFFSAFDRNDCIVYAFSTSATAEGVDFPGVSLVIVCGGVYGGLLSVHQMANRAGRGTERQVPPPEAMVLYAPNFITDAAFNGDEDAVKEFDRRALDPFLLDARPKVKRVVGISSIAALFGNMSECGGRAMELALDVRELSPRCERCNRCMGDRWTHSLPPQHISSATGTRRISARSTSVTMQRITSSSSRVANAAIHTTWEFLSSCRNTCPICPANRVGTVHFPNLCPILRKLVEINAVCYCCFQVGHTYQQVQQNLREMSSPEERFRNSLISQCAVVVEKCNAWQTLKPCSVCWLVHPMESLPCSRSHADSRVRAIFLFVWNNKAVRKEFLETLPLELSTTLSSWKEFMQWGVYRARGQLQNAYVVVSFFTSNKLQLIS